MLVDWLAKLVEVLSPNGLLMFTTHNTTMNKNIDASADIYYSSSSEDAVLNMVSDHLSDDSEYGTTYISGQKIKQLMEGMSLSFEIKPKAFGNRKDVIIAQKK